MGRTKMPRWTAKDTARETDSSIKDTNRAFHDSRESAASSGHLDERNESKVSDSEEGKSIWGIITSILGKKDD